MTLHPNASGPHLMPANARPWSALSVEEKTGALAAALLPFASTGSLALVEAAGACLLGRFEAAERDPPQPLARQTRSRLYDFCRRAAKRVLEGWGETPFPGAVMVKPIAARAPQDHRLAGVIAGWAFYDAKETA